MSDKHSNSLYILSTQFNSKGQRKSQRIHIEVEIEQILGAICVQLSGYVCEITISLSNMEVPILLPLGPWLQTMYLVLNMKP